MDLIFLESNRADEKDKKLSPGVVVQQEGIAHSIVGVLCH
jgi:hypothetical protein